MCSVPEEVIDAIVNYIDFCSSDDHERLLVAWLDSLSAAPEPDWSQAPDWAQWWAVEHYEVAHWYENEPLIDDGGWEVHPLSDMEYAGDVSIPLGIDWRLCKCKRPEANECPGR